MVLAPKQQAAIDLLREGPEYERYFFSRFSDIELFLDLKKEGFFNSQYNPSPIASKDQEGFFIVPNWPALEYLERISKLCSRPEYSKQAKELIEIIREVSHPKTKPKSDNYRTWDSFVRIMTNLPTDVIALEDIELVREWLDSRFDTSLVGAEIGKTLLPRFLKSDKPVDWQKATRIIEIMTEIKWIQSATKSSESKAVLEPEVKIPSYWMRELFKKNASHLGQLCGKKVVLYLRDRLAEVLTRHHDKDQYSYVWRPAIEDHEQNMSEDDLDHVLIVALRDVLLSYARHASSSEASPLLREIIKSNLNIVKRIAIHVIDVLFDKYDFLFWEELDPVLFKNDIRHEMYMLIRNRFETFSTDQKDQTIDLIGRLTEDGADGAENERWNTILRAQWMSALIGKGSPKADLLYASYIDIIGNQYEPEHPEFTSYMTIGTVSEDSPVSPRELLEKGSVKQIVEFMNNFDQKEVRNEYASEDSIESLLGRSLKEAIKIRPDLFDGRLAGFLECRFPYQYDVIQAFKELWVDKKAVNWQELLEFCFQLVKKPELWQDQGTMKDQDGKKDWIPTAIAELIKSGVANDETAFDPQYLPKTGKVLITILDNQTPAELKKGDQDFINWAINTSRGRSLEALFFYALRCIRVAEKKGEKKERVWKNLQPIFDRELGSIGKGNYEFSALAGKYLPNLYYMSKTWVEKNINKLFPNKTLSMITNWQAAIEGYCYVNTVYTVIYDLLKQNGDVQKVLAEIVEPEQTRKKIIDNIAVSYLRGQESLEKGSLFLQILQDWHRNDILGLTHLFWTHRNVDISNQQKKRILNFWKYCYDRIKGNDDKNQDILSKLNLLAVFLDEISVESKQWLIQSAPYVEQRHNAFYLLEDLDRLANVKPTEVGEVYLSMLKTSIPTYKEENITSIVVKLYKNKNHDLADQICDHYGRAGHEFLRPIYEQNHRK